MAWTNPRTWVAGEKPTAATLNTHIRDNLAHLGNPPRCSLYLTADQLIANTTATDLSGWTELEDTDTMYDAGSPTRITFKTAGLFTVNACVRYANNATGYRAALVRLNGSNDIANAYVAASSTLATTATISFDYRFAVNDYITLQARQSSGGDLNALGTLDEYTFFQARWVAA